MPVTKTTTKEYGEIKRQRRQSADKEDNDKETTNKGGPDLSEFGDRDDSKVWGERW